MVLKRTRLFLLLSLILLVVLAACVPQTPPPPEETAAPAELPTARAHLETLVLPTVTTTPTATRAFTATWTVTAGPTHSPTPTARFAEAEVISLTNPVGSYQVALRVPGITAALDVILESRKFKCLIDPAAPETLFCNGLAGPPVDQQISIAFVDPATEKPVYNGKTVISRAAVPTSTPEGFFSCPDRGKDVFCEVECRIYGGNPCIVATCNDACGLYYSIHDCPQSIPNDGMCQPELELEMRIKYGLPH